MPSSAMLSLLKSASWFLSEAVSLTGGTTTTATAADVVDAGLTAEIAGAAARSAPRTVARRRRIGHGGVRAATAALAAHHPAEAVHQHRSADCADGCGRGRAEERAAARAWRLLLLLRRRRAACLLLRPG